MEPTGKVKEIASKILSGKEAFPFGICSFEQILPCLECRAKQRIPQDAASVLVCLFPYYTGEHKERNISRYAMVTDYHMIAGEYLNRFCKALQEVFPQNQFEPFTDNSPIREVSAAFHAGLGRRGKNGLILHPKYGSYVFIGEVVTDLVLQPDQPLNPGECIGCGKCQKVCPQGALRSDGSVCLERCRSHITQKKGELTDWEIGQIQDGGLIWGCDICNDACPMNQEAKVLTPVPEFLESAVAVLDAQIAERLLKTRAYNYRGKKTILRNIQLLEGANEDDR
ncbi:MAG: epoxyqueuosine reductase [Negativibacillus massiliensis]|uniref:epoxyqueuosine reductase n=1 Tax=Negativibacillus massiliensis TaxID=1871035 RepID=UPI00399C3120